MTSIGYVPDNDPEHDRYDISPWQRSFPQRWNGLLIDPRDRQSFFRPRKQSLRLRLTTRLPRINLRWS